MFSALAMSQPWALCSICFGHFSKFASRCFGPNCAVFWVTPTLQLSAAAGCCAHLTMLRPIAHCSSAAGLQVCLSSGQGTSDGGWEERHSGCKSHVSWPVVCMGRLQLAHMPQAEVLQPSNPAAHVGKDRSQNSAATSPPAPYSYLPTAAASHCSRRVPRHCLPPPLWLPVSTCCLPSCAACSMPLCSPPCNQIPTFYCCAQWLPSTKRHCANFASPLSPLPTPGRNASTGAQPAAAASHITQPTA